MNTEYYREGNSFKIVRLGKKLTTTAMIAIVSYDGKSDHFEITKYLVFLERLTFGKWSRTSAYGVERIKA